MPPLPHRLAVALAVWFGCGRLPWAPGTWGTLGGLPFAWGALQFGLGAGLALTALLFVAGLWASARHMDATGEDDPPEIVIDEVAGVSFCLCFAPLTPLGVVAAFLLFRLFDIAKPFPVRRLETAAPGAWGVMLDDMAAGLYSGLCLLLLRAIGIL